MSTNLPSFAPVVTEETEPFWAATARDQLVLPTCDDCGFVIWYPRGFCPECASFNISWVESPGAGTIYSFTVVRKGFGPWGEAAPYVLAYVELAEGPRVMTNIVTDDPESISIGQGVRVCFDATDGDHKLPRWAPASA